MYKNFLHDKRISLKYEIWGHFWEFEPWRKMFVILSRNDYFWPQKPLLKAATSFRITVDPIWETFEKCVRKTFNDMSSRTKNNIVLNISCFW